MGKYHSVTTTIEGKTITVDEAREWLTKTGRLILDKRLSLLDWQASLYVGDLVEIKSYGNDKDLAILALFDHIIMRLLVEIERIEKSKS